MKTDLGHPAVLAAWAAFDRKASTRVAGWDRAESAIRSALTSGVSRELSDEVKRFPGTSVMVSLVPKGVQIVLLHYSADPETAKNTSQYIFGSHPYQFTPYGEIFRSVAVYSLRDIA